MQSGKHTRWRAFFWRLNCLTIGPYLRAKCNISLDATAQPFPKPPFVCVSNHGTFFDPWIIGVRSWHPLSIMMNDDGFRSGSATRWYLHNIGAFPKKKGAHDFVAMKKTLGLLRGGNAVLIFPEGQTTWDGRTQPVYAGIERIIKRTGAHLVIHRIEGNFLSRPWWAHTWRRGAVRLYRSVIPAETIKALDEEEIRRRIIEGIRTDEIANPRNQAVAFRGRDCAVGLERLLWRCFLCGAEDSLRASHDTICCSSCNTTWRYDANGFFRRDGAGTARPVALTEWVDAQRNEALARIARTDSSTLARGSGALLQTLDSSGSFVSRRTGSLHLDRQGLRFSASGMPDMYWPVAAVNDYVIQKKDIFEFKDDTTTYRFVFDRKSPMKWLSFFRYLNNFQECEQRGYQ